MGSIAELLQQTTHRPWELPTTGWSYYQEWNNALFFHWEIPLELLQSLVPSNLKVDLYEGKAYISLVPFTMQKIRPKYLPSLAFVSDFHEINLRTYVTHQGKPGVFFISIEAEKSLSAFLSRMLSGLPYKKSTMVRTPKGYTSQNKLQDFRFSAEYEIQEVIVAKTGLDRFLTERYSLYLERNGKLYRYQIHHKEWELRNVRMDKFDSKYIINALNLEGKVPDLMHYSEGVQVIAWDREVLS